MKPSGLIAFASDHAGLELKKTLLLDLKARGIHAKDFGTHTSASCDYPDYAHPLAAAIAKRECAMGVLICGSANGVCMTANKHAGVRAALAWTAEIAALARQHNDANVICLPARYITSEVASSIVETFLETEFEGGRHQKRVDKIDK